MKAKPKVKREMPRMLDWVFYSIVLAGIVYWVAPQQLTVVAYKAALVALATVLAYMIDLSLFKRVERIGNESKRDVYSAARLLARALVFLGTVVALTLGI